MMPQKMDSETWLTLGDWLFCDCDNVCAVRNWFASKGDLPRSQTREFWCSLCGESGITPTSCPKGHKADDVEDRIELTHKGYTANTFPYFTIQRKETHECEH